MKAIIKFIKRIVLGNTFIVFYSAVMIGFTAFFAGQDFQKKEYMTSLAFVLLSLAWIGMLYHFLLKMGIRVQEKLSLTGTFKSAELTNHSIPSLSCPVFIKTKSGQEIQIQCLIDTGFTGWLSIDENIERQLGLIPIGCAEGTSFTSTFTANAYKIDFRIGSSSFQNITLVASKYPANSYQGVIGMQLISQGKLGIEKIGDKYSYSFTI